ncbi:MAG: glycerophosphoryl diester phosphodiesterase membrane domain-containing protein [Croceibacterium sp.]
MATQIEGGEALSVGRVLSRGFGVIADNPLTVLGIALVLGALPAAAIGLVQSKMLVGEMDSFQAIGSVSITLFSFVIGMAIQALVQGSLVRATLAYARGERATFGECIGAALAVVLPLVGLAIVTALAVGLGFILLIIPGILLYVRWAVASPALVAERIGVFEALGRSRDLTRGVRWKVFGIEAILVVGYYIFMAVLGGTLIATGGIDFTSVPAASLSAGWIIATVLLSTIVNTVWSTVQSSLYVELRNSKEGLPEQALEEIFA